MINETLKTQKDNLAKLMASEDITVVHKKIPTAYFDVQNRILACPIFKDDMSSELYDLFMGHEVGHALNTPLEGLHSTLKENRTLKGYLNVIEDVRIETAIKNKFPGLRKSFFSAYNELMEMDFFGVKNRDLQELSLIDKINLITKVGARVQINLNDVEQGFLSMAYACKTWEDVVECANAIYEWSKENEERDENDESIVPKMFDLDDEDENEDEYEDSEDSYNDNFTDLDEDFKDEDNLPEISSETKEDGNIEQEDGEEESEGEVEETKPKEERKDTGGKDGSEFGVHDDENGARESITEHSAHNNEEMFLSEDNVVTETTDLKPKFKDIEKNVIGYKKVIQDFESTEQDETTIKKAIKTKQNLQNKNKNIVNHMAKQFEMKQSAKRAVHAFSGKTGKLDMNKLAKYQIVDDIFKRVTYLPEGKNHGINVLLDWSGSIMGEVRDLLEQSIILAEFCRKTEIPFRVYAFSDSYNRKSDYDYDVDVSSVLIEFLSSEMTSREFDKMYTNLAMIWDSHFAGNIYYGSWKKREKNVEEYNNWYGDAHHLEVDMLWNVDRFTLPRGYSLGGTPLDECLIYMRKLIPLFNKKYGIEKSILTVITDGYSHHSDLLNQTKEERELDGEQMHDDDSYYGMKRLKQFIDPYSRKVYKVSKVAGYYSRDSFYKTQCLLDWIQKETGVIINGYFVLPSKKDLWNLLSYLDNNMYDDDVKKLWTSIRKTGQVMNVFGYNKLFLTSSSALNTQGEDTLDDELIDAKKVRVLAAFKKNQNSKTTSRFLTNEFIKEIA